MIAVIPAFRPDDGLLRGVRSLSPQVEAVIIVDDGSPAGSADLLDSAVATGVEVIRSTSNLGIAAALNTGIRLALERGADFVLDGEVASKKTTTNGVGVDPIAARH